MTWTTSSVPYVVPPKPGEADAWTQAGGGQRLLSVDVVVAPDDVREALQLAVGAEVVRRSRLILRGGEPIEVATSHWPAAWAAATPLAEPKPVKGGTVRLLADMGHTATKTIEDLDAMLAEHADVPSAPAGAALLAIFRTLVGPDGVPFEYCAMHRWNRQRQRYVLELI